MDLILVNHHDVKRSGDAYPERVFVAMVIQKKVLFILLLFLLLSIPVSAHHHHHRKSEEQSITIEEQSEPVDQTEESLPTPTQVESPTPSPTVTDSPTLIHQEDPHIAGSGSDNTITIAENNSTSIQVPDPKPCDSNAQEAINVANVNDLHLSQDVNINATESAHAQSVVIGNTNLTGNCWVYTNVNVMGSQAGSIVLPSDSHVIATTIEATPQLTVTNINNSNVANNVIVSAQGTEAKVTVTDLSEVNTNITGNGWSMVVIHTPGEIWQGSLIGFPAAYQRNQDMTYAYYQSPLSQISNTPMLVSNTNKADITTKVNASIVSTDKAEMKVNLLTIANTNITGNNWYYALINVLNGFNGDVIIPRPDLEISISPHNQVTHVGDEVIYTISYKNRGQEDASNAEIVAEIPQGAQFGTAQNDGSFEQNEVHWRKNLIKAGDEGSVIYKVVLGNTPFNSLYASVRIRTDTYEWNLANNTSSTGITVLPIPAPAIPLPTPEYDLPLVIETPVYTSEKSTPIVLAANTHETVLHKQNNKEIPYTAIKTESTGMKQLIVELGEMIVLTFGITVAAVRMRSQIIDRV